MPFSRGSSWHGIKPGSPTLQARSLPSEPPGMCKTDSGPVATDAPGQALLRAAVALLCYVSCNLGTAVHRGKRAEKTHGKKQGLLKWETIWPAHTLNFLMAFWLLPFLVHNYASISLTLLEVKWGPLVLWNKMLKHLPYGIINSKLCSLTLHTIEFCDRNCCPPCS